MDSRFFKEYYSDTIFIVFLLAIARYFQQNKTETKKILMYG